MDNGTDWLMMPESAGERLAAVSPRTKSQPHTATAPFLPTPSHATYKLRADEAMQHPRQSTSPVPARQPTSSAAERKSFSSGKQPAVSARKYSPSSPHTAPRRMHGAALEHPARVSAASPEATARADLERKLSSSINLQQPSQTTAAERHISPKKTTRAYLEPKAHSRVQQRTKVIPSGSSEGGAQSAPAPTSMAAHARRSTHEPRAQSQTAPAGSGAAHRRTSTRKIMCAHLGLGWSALSQPIRAAILIFQSWERSLADSSRLGAQTGRISTVCSASSSDMPSLAARPVVIFSRQRQIACH